MTGDLRDLVKQHGGDLYAGGRAATMPGPGHSRADRSLSVRLSDDGKVIFHSFANDTVRDCMSYLGIGPAEGRQSTPAERAREKARRERERRQAEAEDREFCRTLWNGTRPIAGTPAEAYLWSRHLVVDGLTDIAFHPAAPRSKDPASDLQPHPAMVALVRDVNRTPKALHVTFITPDGAGKAFGSRSRLMFASVRGHAVQLGWPSDGVLAVGEGIETCGAYATLRGTPCWPCLSTSGLGAFVVPPGVRKLIIAADGDKGGAEAAQRLAERACKACDVLIDPAPNGEDWADVLGRQE